MMRKKAIVSSIAAIALSAAIAVPAFAAPPTYSGTLTCTRDGEVDDLNTLSGATKKEVNEATRFWVTSDFCDKGSVDSSGLTKDA